MSATSEVSGDAGYVETVSAGTETEFPLSGLHLSDQEYEVYSFYGGKHFVDELRSEFIFSDMVSVENVLSKDSPDNRSSLEGYEVFEYVSVELEIVEFLALVGVKNNIFIVRMKGDEFARHLEGARTDAVFEAVRVANNPK